MMSVQKRKILEGEYRVSHIVGAVREGSGRSLMVRWEGYNYLGDTREPEEHVRPRSKVQKYDAGIPLTRSTCPSTSASFGTRSRCT